MFSYVIVENMSCDHRPDMVSSRGETSTVKGVTLSRALDLVSMAMFWYLCMCQLGSVIHRSLAIRRAERITCHAIPVGVVKGVASGC